MERLWSDEPEVAQVERPRIRRDRPNRMLAPPPELKVSSSKLRRDGSLRVKVSWRLGAPEEALCVWLVVHAKDVQRAKPPQILESFAAALCKKRPRLKWRIQYECLQLFSIDGTPLLDDVPLVESLARVSSDELLALPRIRCLTEEKTHKKFVASGVARRRRWGPGGLPVVLRREGGRRYGAHQNGSARRWGRAYRQVKGPRSCLWVTCRDSSSRRPRKQVNGTTTRP